jgi:hypothetical protein
LNFQQEEVAMPDISSISPTLQPARAAAQPNVKAGQNVAQPAGTERPPAKITQAEKVSLSESLQKMQAERAARTQAARDVNSLDFSYSKAEALLRLQVMREETGQKVRELEFRDYQVRGVPKVQPKGGLVDMTG